MKKKTKTKSPKSASKRSAVSERSIPHFVAAMTKIVERLETLEKKTDMISDRIAGLPAEIQHSIQNPQRQEAPHAAQPPRHSGQNPPHSHRRTWYEAVCSGCGKVCEVPFQPTGERPVYCKTCFASRKLNRNNQNQAKTVLVPSAQKSPATPPQETTKKTAATTKRRKAPKSKKTVKKKKKKK